MAVVIDEVNLDVAEAPPAQGPSSGDGQQRRRLDPEELAAALRRRADRETRLWAD
jgi:hypothetical protein